MNEPLRIVFTSVFRKDRKRLVKRGADMSKLKAVLGLLIYRVAEEEMVLIATRSGSHSDLF